MFDWMSGTTVTVVACVVGILIILLVIQMCIRDSGNTM